MQGHSEPSHVYHTTSIRIDPTWQKITRLGFLWTNLEDILLGSPVFH